MSPAAREREARAHSLHRLDGHERRALLDMLALLDEDLHNLGRCEGSSVSGLPVLQEEESEKKMDARIGALAPPLAAAPPPAAAPTLLIQLGGTTLTAPANASAPLKRWSVSPWMSPGVEAMAGGGAETMSTRERVEAR